MVPPLLLEQQVLQTGLKCAGHNESRQKKQNAGENKKRFQEDYGVSPGSVASLLEELKTTNIPGASIIKPNLIHLLMTLDWLTSYDTEGRLAGRYQVTPKTFRKWNWTYVRAIAALKAAKIIWPWSDDGSDGPDFIVSIDGTHCPINEPRTDPSAKWCSHKFKGAGLAYELAVSVHESKLVWINGPFPAGEPDLVIYRKEGGLRDKMPPGKKAIADRGHCGEDQPQLACRNPFDCDAVKEFKSRASARHESFNGRIKNFNVLEQRFRDHRDKHKQAFEAVCVLLQIEMDNGHPLFDV